MNWSRASGPALSLAMVHFSIVRRLMADEIDIAIEEVRMDSRLVEDLGID